MEYKDFFSDFKGLFASDPEFSIEIGWWPLVYDLCQNLEIVSPNAVVVQVKEKFGGLRFYASNVTDEGLDLIAEAEDKSTTICEGCGCKENVTTEGGWLKTYCPTCRANRYK